MAWEPICGLGARTVGWRRGVNQWWPVTDVPEAHHPLAIGGQCPPYAPLTRTAHGYTCVEGASYVERDWRDAMAQRAMAQRLVGRPFKAFGQSTVQGMTTEQLATTMVLRGAVGTLIGAAAAPMGREGIWGAAGFVMGAAFGELGIVGVALAALWRKAG